jgi:subtilisin family serine protease
MGPVRSTAAALALAAVLGAALPAAAARLAPGLRARAAAEGRVRVVVELDVAVAPEALLPPAAVAAQRSRVDDAAARVTDLLSGPRAELDRIGRLPFLALDATPADLDRLAASPLARSVREDRLLRPVLNESVPIVGGDLARARGFDGAGQTVAVLDTGVDRGHEFLAGAIVAEACFSQGRDCPNNQKTMFGSGAAEHCTYAYQCFHGTHVSGIAVGAISYRHGVAPGASLIAISVFSRFTGTACGSGEDPCTQAYTSDIAAGLDHVLTLSASLAIAAVNLSLGGGLYDDPALCDADEPLLVAAVEGLRAAGIATIAAAGNDGATDSLAMPGCLSSAISVGATSDTDLVWNLSNSAPFLSLLAPGLGIISSTPPDVVGQLYKSFNGTSMATPHVTGAFALMRQAVPTASVDAILAALQATGVPITDYRSGQLTPRLQVDQALLAITPACSNGVDDDGDGKVDWDGGPSGEPADAQCNGDPNRDRERNASCGLGFEAGLAVALAAALRRRRAGARVS